MPISAICCGVRWTPNVGIPREFRACHTVLTLTPREARMLGNLMCAEAMQYANIELGHNMALIHSEVAGQVRALARQVNGIVDQQAAG